jgi:hypothetical protein
MQQCSLQVAPLIATYVSSGTTTVHAACFAANAAAAPAAAVTGQSRGFEIKLIHAGFGTSQVVFVSG